MERKEGQIDFFSQTGDAKGFNFFRDFEGEVQLSVLFVNNHPDLRDIDFRLRFNIVNVDYVLNVAYKTTTTSRVKANRGNGDLNTPVFGSVQGALPKTGSLTSYLYSFSVRNSFNTGNSTSGQMLKEILVRMSRMAAENSQNQGSLDTQNGRVPIVPTTYSEELRAMEFSVLNLLMVTIREMMNLILVIFSLILTNNPF